MGGREPPRLRRRARGLGERRAAVGRRHRQTGAARAPPGLGRREAQRNDARPLPAHRRADCALARSAARTALFSPLSHSTRSSSAQAAIRSMPSSSQSSTSNGARPSWAAAARRPFRGSSPPASMRSRQSEKTRAAGLGCGREGVLGECARRKMMIASAALHCPRAQRLRPTAEALIPGGRERVRLRPCARPGRCLRTDSPNRHRSRSTATSPSGWRPSGAPKTTPEMLAHHWRSALELARAAGRGRRRPRHTHAPRAARCRRSRVLAQRFRRRREVLRRGARALARPDARTSSSSSSAVHAPSIVADDRAEQALDRERGMRCSNVGDAETAAEAEAFLSTASLVSGEDRRCQRASRECPGAHRGAEALDGEGTRPLRHGPEPDARGRDLDDALRIAHEALALAEESSSSTRYARMRSRRSGR